MKISHIIARLQEIQSQHGDLTATTYTGEPLWQGEVHKVLVAENTGMDGDMPNPHVVFEV